MTNKESSPPRLAEMVLRLSLKPSDRESISGDLLEEYRAGRPELQHIFVTMAAVQGVLYGSVVPAPGVSLFDALIYLAAAYHGVQRTRLIRTGLLAAGATSVVGFTVLFAAAAVITPSLVLAPFVKPFIFVILSVYLLIPVGYALLLGGLVRRHR